MDETSMPNASARNRDQLLAQQDHSQDFERDAAPAVQARNVFEQDVIWPSARKSRGYS